MFCNKAMTWHRAAWLVVLVLTAISSSVRADFTFGAPVNIQSDFPFLDPATDWLFCFSPDELEVYLCISGHHMGGYGQ